MKAIRFALAAVCALAMCVGLAIGCQPSASQPGPHHVGAYAPQPTDANRQLNWYIDPANSTGCATDSANVPGWGTSATCSGGNGPLLTWYGLNVQRWNCFGFPSGCPRLQNQVTDGTPSVYTVTFLSSQSGNTDPVSSSPHVHGVWCVNRFVKVHEPDKHGPF